MRLLSKHTFQAKIRVERIRTVQAMINPPVINTRIQSPFLKSRQNSGSGGGGEVPRLEVERDNLVIVDGWTVVDVNISVVFTLGWV